MWVALGRGADVGWLVMLAAFVNAYRIGVATSVSDASRCRAVRRRERSQSPYKDCRSSLVTSKVTGRKLSQALLRATLRHSDEFDRSRARSGKCEHCGRMRGSLQKIRRTDHNTTRHKPVKAERCRFTLVIRTFLFQSLDRRDSPLGTSFGRCLRTKVPKVQRSRCFLRNQGNSIVSPEIVVAFPEVLAVGEISGTRAASTLSFGQRSVYAGASFARRVFLL